MREWLSSPHQEVWEYRIVSNLTDISNYSDTISNYFLPLITPDSQWSLNFCCSNHLDIIVLMQTAWLARYLYQGLYIIFQMDWKRLRSRKFYNHRYARSVPGNVWQYCYYTGLGCQDSQYLQLLDHTSIWPNAHVWKRVLIHWTLRMPTIFVCSNYSRHWPK